MRVPSGDEWTVAPFLQFAGHAVAVVTGPVFLPNGSRLSVSSQRGTDGDWDDDEIADLFASR